MTLPAESNSITITSLTYNLGQSGVLLAATASRSGCTADGASGSTSPVVGTRPGGRRAAESSLSTKRLAPTRRDTRVTHIGGK